VIWEADRNDIAPYDVRSLDEDRHVIYIEVKSTTGTDETAPFDISDAEHRFAFEKGSRHFVYRVTDIKSARPLIHTYRDPIRGLREGTARLRWKSAKLSLPKARPDVEGGEEG
jgi:hypothetical protein